ncbi:MAG: fimbrial protein [Acinetobacter sp.]
MKKSIIASVVMLGFIGTAAHAANNDISFLGAVTSTTCNLTTSVGGVAQPNGVVQLGTVAPEKEGSTVEFSLMPINKTDGACTGLTDKQTATMSWASASLGANGFGATSGAASDSVVEVNSVNSKVPGAVNISSSVIDFAANKVATEGLKFNAKLKAGKTAGDFKSVASIAIAYK